MFHIEGLKSLSRHQDMREILGLLHLHHNKLAWMSLIADFCSNSYLRAMTYLRTANLFLRGTCSFLFPDTWHKSSSLCVLWYTPGPTRYLGMSLIITSFPSSEVMWKCISRRPHSNSVKKQIFSVFLKKNYFFLTQELFSLQHL